MSPYSPPIRLGYTNSSTLLGILLTIRHIYLISLVIILIFFVYHFFLKESISAVSSQLVSLSFHPPVSFTNPPSFYLPPPFLLLLEATTVIPSKPSLSPLHPLTPSPLLSVSFFPTAPTDPTSRWVQVKGVHEECSPRAPLTWPGLGTLRAPTRVGTLMALILAPSKTGIIIAVGEPSSVRLWPRLHHFFSASGTKIVYRR